MPKGVYVRSESNKRSIALGAQERWTRQSERDAASRIASERYADPVRGEKLKRGQALTLEKSRQTMLERYGTIYPGGIKGVLTPFKMEYWIAKGHTEEEARAILSQNGAKAAEMAAESGNLKSPWQKSYWVDLGFTPEEAVVKVSELQRGNSLKNVYYNVSGVCTEFLDWLGTKISRKIEREVLVPPFRVDGVIDDRIVVEVFGDFWHMRPAEYGPDDINKVTGRKAKGIWREDAGRLKLLRKRGYKVFMIWADDCSIPRKRNKLARSVRDALLCEGGACPIEPDLRQG